MKKKFKENYFIFLKWHMTLQGLRSKLQNLHMVRKGGKYITSIKSASSNTRWGVTNHNKQEHNEVST